MLLVDAAVGSNELLAPLQRLGLPAELTHLESADLAFMGRGEKGAPLFIGIEVKKLSELLTSLQTGRLAGHQLLEMTKVYDRRYLLVEGDFSSDEQGRMVQPWGERRPMRGAPPAVEFEKRLLNLQTRGGLITRHVSRRQDTLRVIVAYYRYWTDVDLDAHKSHLAVYAPDLDRALCIPISDFRRLAAQLPGVGYKMSGAVEQAFGGSFRKMMLAGVGEWADIATTDDKGKTKRLGEKKARQIMEALK